MKRNKKFICKQNHPRKTMLDKRLIGYSAAAVAALACGAPEAWASPIKFTPTSPVIIGINGSYQLNMDGNNTNDFNFILNGGRSAYITKIANAGINGFSWGSARRLGLGNAIGGNLQFWGRARLAASFYHGLYKYGNFLGQEGFLGVKFNIDSKSHYGWIDVAVNSNVSKLTIYGWGYESSVDTAITAGVASAPVNRTPAPEPGTLTLLAAGAAGLFAWRGNRKKDSEPV